MSAPIEGVGANVDAFHKWAGERQWFVEPLAEKEAFLAGYAAGVSAPLGLILSEDEWITLASILEEWIEDNHDEDDAEVTHGAAELRKRLQGLRP